MCLAALGEDFVDQFTGADGHRLDANFLTALEGMARGVEGGGDLVDPLLFLRTVREEHLDLAVLVVFRALLAALDDHHFVRAQRFADRPDRAGPKGPAGRQGKNRARKPRNSTCNHVNEPCD